MNNSKASYQRVIAIYSIVVILPTLSLSFLLLPRTSPCSIRLVNLDRQREVNQNHHYVLSLHFQKNIKYNQCDKQINRLHLQSKLYSDDSKSIRTTWNYAKSSNQTWSQKGRTNIWMNTNANSYETMDSKKDDNISLTFPSPTPVTSTTSSTNAVSTIIKEEYVLPNLDSPLLSRLGKEFYSMIHDFTVFSPRDIANVPNPRYRAIYEGVAAGSKEGAVLHAFAVIFEDLVPVRIAGRMIYRHLKDVMERNIEKRLREEERVQNTTGLSLNVIDDGRKAFMALLEQHEEDGGQLTMAQLIDSGIVETVVEILELESFDEFVHTMEKDKDGKLNFEMFMIGLQRCTDQTCEDTSCEVQDVLNEIIKRIQPFEEKKATKKDEQHKKHIDKFDHMVRSFKEWETLIPTGEGRMLDVLRGCFVGASNEKIVSALKIVYLDYSALRIGGDLVFSLMSKLVPSNKKR